MYKNEYTITELDKQIILFSKNWFGDYLNDNKIEISSIEILKHMIAVYVGSEPEHITVDNVYHWVSQLYCYLSDSGEFCELSTKNLLDRFTRILNPMWKTNNSKEEELILTLLGSISNTTAIGLDTLGIDLGEPDYEFLKGIKCIKNGLELIDSVKDDQQIIFNIRNMTGEYVLCGGNSETVKCVNKKWLKYNDSEDIIDVDFKNIYNIRYQQKEHAESR